MESAALNFRAFAFIITLAAVVNGLGIVRWLTAFSEYLCQRDSLEIRHSWLYNFLASYQFLLHVVMWWTLWSVHDVAHFNFLTYLYLLTGPVLLFLGTSLLTPKFDSGQIDVRTLFDKARPTYATVLVLLWAWALGSGPILRGEFAPSAPVLALFLVSALVLRLSRNEKAHAFAIACNWLLIMAFVAMYAMELGSNAAQ